MKKIFLLLFALVTFFIFSCNKSGNSDSELKTQDLTLTTPAVKDEAVSNKLFKNKNSDSSSGISLQGTTPGQNPDWDKKIIKTAFLKLEVKDFKTYAQIVHNATKQYGGYIANEEQNESEGKIESTISIKVPVEQFESIMTQLPTSAEKIIEKKITTEDVTGEVVDTKSRLQAKE